jgi:RecG-like helicase
MSGDKLGADARTRLQTLVRSNDGFEISEVDLRLRGPGDLMGTQQSGLPMLHIADLVQDVETAAAGTCCCAAHARCRSRIARPGTCACGGYSWPNR